MDTFASLGVFLPRIAQMTTDISLKSLISSVLPVSSVANFIVN